MAIWPWSAPFFPPQKRRIANILQATHVGISTVVILHPLQRNITWTAAVAIDGPADDSHEQWTCLPASPRSAKLVCPTVLYGAKLVPPKTNTCLQTTDAQQRSHAKLQGQTITAPFVNDCVVNHHHPHIAPFLSYHDTKGNLIGTNYHSSQLQ